ncbi:hypothetical protein MCEMSEM18_00143 [Comamonadaceae bacterium]
MKFQKMLPAVLGLAFALCQINSVAQTDKDTVRWDDRAGQWVYTLYNPSDLSRYKVERYTPRTLIEPQVSSSVRWDKDVYEYRYRIRNTNQARQSISEITVRAPKWDSPGVERKPLASDLTSLQIIAISRAERASEKAFVAKTLYSPHRWKPYLNVNNPSKVGFGWLADLQKDYNGIAPRSSQGNFSVLRPELPGAGWMQLQGDTPDLYNAAILPQSGVLAEQVAELLKNDSVWVPVMLPAIVLPKPYDAAELSRRLKDHIGTWPESGLIDSTVWAALAPKLDALTAALAVKDHKTARLTAQAVLAQVRIQYAGVEEGRGDEDDEANDSRASERQLLTARGTLETVSETMPPMQRVAVRALTFNVRYLLERMESGR